VDNIVGAVGGNLMTLQACAPCGGLRVGISLLNATMFAPADFRLPKDNQFPQVTENRVLSKPGRRKKRGISWSSHRSVSLQAGIRLGVFPSNRRRPEINPV